MQRVAELRKDGMWSARRLPKVSEPPRQKAHWDYLLEEMQWLAADFAQERKWKKAGARKVRGLFCAPSFVFTNREISVTAVIMNQYHFISDRTNDSPLSCRYSSERIESRKRRRAAIEKDCQSDGENGQGILVEH